MAPVVSRAVALVLGFVLAACGSGAPSNPTAAEQTFGTAVPTTGAVPAPAVAAEADRYLDRAVTVDGRIDSILDAGCSVLLRTGGRPLRIDAPRMPDGCTWRVPTALDGIAAAAGTLRADGDTLRLSANGVRVTPVQARESGS